MSDLQNELEVNSGSNESTENKVTDDNVAFTPIHEEQLTEHPIVHSPVEEHEESEALENFSELSKDELVAAMEQVATDPDVINQKNKINPIKDAFNSLVDQEYKSKLALFIEEGGIEDDFKPVADPLEERFTSALKKFNKRKAEFLEQQEKQREENLKLKNQVLADLKNLIQNEENMQRAFEQFHDLQSRWRSIGPVPSQQVKDLWMTYKLFTDKFYELIKINRELQELDQKKNLEIKINLCERAEELLLESAVNKAINELHILQDKWRETGPVSREKRNEIWDRFKIASDKIFDRRKTFVEELKQKHAVNLALKTALCEKAEAISNTDYARHLEWQDKAKELLGIQTEWKGIGAADRKNNDEIWKRFRMACDAFFKKKNDYYQQVKKEYQNNLQLKTELCIQAEALKDNTDWKNTTKEIIRLQQEWKKIGPVGEKNSNKIWFRFREACDAYFKNKSDHYSSMESEQKENLGKKLAIIEEAENFTASDNNQDTLDHLKSLQRSWSEIGLVPFENKEEVQKRYKTAIDAIFKKVNITEIEKFKLRHPSQEENGLKIPNEIVRKEQSSLKHKLHELTNEVQVWENNIGFFAKSKNAESLKKEFEDKISKAKAEISALKKQLDAIRSM